MSAKHSFLLIFFLITCSSLSLYSQATEETRDEKKHFTLRTELKSSQLEAMLNHTGKENYDIDLAADPREALGIQCTYEDFTAGITTEFSGLDQSFIQDLYLLNLGKRYGVEFFYQHYSHFYVADKNSKRKYPETPDEYPDMRIINTGLSFYYFLKDNNYRGLYSQSRELTRNSWSPFIKVTTGWVQIKDNKAIIPEEDNDIFNKKIQYVRRIDSYQFKLTPGITGTLAWKNFYSTALITFGGVLMHQEYRDHSSSGRDNLNTDFDLGFQFVTGYSGKTFFCGIWFINENLYSAIEDMQVQIMNFQSSIFLGIKV